MKKFTTPFLILGVTTVLGLFSVSEIRADTLISSSEVTGSSDSCQALIDEALKQCRTSLDAGMEQLKLRRSFPRACLNLHGDDLFRCLEDQREHDGPRYRSSFWELYQAVIDAFARCRSDALDSYLQCRNGESDAQGSVVID